MKMFAKLGAASFALAACAAGTAAHAGTYAFAPNPVALGVTPSAGAFDANFGSTAPKTFDDDFTFTTNATLADGFAVVLDEYPSPIDKISAVDLQVFAGTPSAPGKLLDSGDFTVTSTAPVVSEFLPAVNIGPGSYFLQAAVTVPGGDLAYYTAQVAPAPAFAVSAAPEPSTWALMIAGLGVVGFALRRAPGRARVEDLVRA